MGPVSSENEEQQENIPKMLCQLDNHLACVNCVRWSVNGKLLASAGDDKVIMIWQFARYNGPGCSTFGGPTNVEQWRCVNTLRGHAGDILDLNWSPGDNWLASCSVDNSVIIWNAQKWPEIVVTLRGHTGLVKGIAWDPIGKYISSQSDDKSLRIWRTSDWSEETVITEPFTECGGTTHVLRLNWSPDGQFLVSAHAMNNLGSVAQIIERQGWVTSRDFVGHRKAVTCVRFNPNILTKNNENGKVQKFCCTAIGSRDRSLSVWLTSLKRPLVVIHDLFSNSVLDLSWSQNGTQLLVCSWDGSVAYVEFDEKEIGLKLSSEELVKFKQKLYGKALQVDETATVLIEDPELLKVRDEQQKEKQQNGQLNGSSESCKLLDSNNASRSNASSNQMLKGPTDKQIETLLPDGRRRITPLYIPPPIDLGGTPLPFTAQPTTFSSSSEPRTKIQIERRDESNSKSLTKSSTPLVNSSEKHNLTKALPNVDITPIPLCDPEPKEGHKNRERIDTAKRKLPSTEALPAAKRKPGRPPITQKEHKNQQHLTSDQLTPAPTQEKRKVEGRTLPSSSVHLPPLKMDKYFSCSISKISTDVGEKHIYLEVENNINSTVLSALRLNENEDRKWEVLVSGKFIGIATSESLISAACDDYTISVFTVNTGRRLFSPIALNSYVARLTCFGNYVMALTTKGALWLWNFETNEVIVKSESLLPLFAGANPSEISILNTGITSNGAPMVSLSSGKSFIFNKKLGTWTLIANSSDILSACSDHKPTSFEPSTLPLTAIQSQHK